MYKMSPQVLFIVVASVLNLSQVLNLFSKNTINIKSPNSQLVCCHFWTLSHRMQNAELLTS